MTTTNTTSQEVPDSASTYLDLLEQELPRLCTPHDLVEIGLFKDRVEVTEIRRRGCGPDFIRLGPKKFRYTKEAILEWVRKGAQQPQSEEQAA